VNKPRRLIAIALLLSPFGQSFAAAGNPNPLNETAWASAARELDIDRFRTLVGNAQQAGFPTTATKFLLAFFFLESSLPADVLVAAQVPEFRVEAGVYLASAVRNKVLIERVQSITAALREMASPTSPVRHRALYVLGILRDFDSIPLLERSARDSDNNVFMPAVLGLRLMCSAQALKALDRVRVTTKSRERLEYIERSSSFTRSCEEVAS